jgi:GMP synthase-like glutamine amidotransferase
MATMMICSAGSSLGVGFEFVTYPALDGVIPKSVRDADGWLITGSKFSVYENHSWIPPLEDFLRRAYAEAVPIVGICFGHQLMAQAPESETNANAISFLLRNFLIVLDNDLSAGTQILGEESCVALIAKSMI